MNVFGLHYNVTSFTQEISVEIFMLEREGVQCFRKLPNEMLNDSEIYRKLMK